MKGDYQSQRNLAYGYVAFPYAGQEENPILGCAWYYLIVQSGSPRVDQTDLGNFKVYCGRLEPMALTAAEAQARVLYRRVYRRAPSF
jgi:hypothetical protein